MTLLDPMTPNDRDVLTVSDLNRKARQLLETHLPLLWVEGELSNFSRPSSGHWYFTLKDSNAQVRCAMFRNRNGMVRFKPEQGQQVLLRARVSLYEGRGDYQLIAEHMEEAGFGVLQRAFEALKAKLSKEGLFEEDHKQPLPLLPKHIAVITSPTGAAIRDVLSVLGRRFPAIPITVLPVAVQGEGAAHQIVEALNRANAAKQFDVILLTRGGGSLEDLWPFNEEIVARAIFASKLPVISAVGHEVDVTISDFVADVRAATPSAAAELLSPDRHELLKTFFGFEVLLEQTLQRTLAQKRLALYNLGKRLRHPGERIQSRAQHLDNLEMRMHKAIGFQLHQTKNRLFSAALRQQHLHPGKQIKQLQLNTTSLLKRAQRQMTQTLHMEQQRFAQAIELLQTVSPLQTLKRGYSVVIDEQGNILKNSDGIKVGTQLTTKLGRGEVLSTVEAVKPDYTSVTARFPAKK